ncbi:hypothetical protein AAE478_002522 [Parahypoxylon ruwenzoriense]
MASEKSPESPRKCGNPKCSKTSDSVALQQCSRCRKVAYCSKDCQAASWPGHKKQCRRQNYIVKFHLAPNDIKDPHVVRTLSCPADAVFYHLHMALQIAFGWGTIHSFDFAVANPDYKPPEDMMEPMRYRMMMDSTGGRADPSMPQEYLFRVVDPVEQTVFSGIDRVHESPRRHPNTPEKKSDDYKLYQLFDNPKYQGQSSTTIIIYTYDFGDNWEHYLTIEGRADATNDFVCLGGSGHPVAEDVGGVRGWADLKAAYRAAHPTREQRDRRNWFEKACRNRDPAGLAGDGASKWNRDSINYELKSERLFDHFDRLADMTEAQMSQFEQQMRRE